MPLEYSKGLKNSSRYLRQNMTDAEKLLWRKIRRKQIKGAQFYRQKPIGCYIVDFYCPKAKLVIEIDGGQHFEEANVIMDEIRGRYLKNLKLKILRFTNIDILKNIDSVIEKVISEI